MPLIKVKAQDWDDKFMHHPPLKDTIINTEDIQSASPAGEVAGQQFAKVRFRNGKMMMVVGQPDQFLPPAQLPRHVEK